jgi:hypothetical protein
MRLLLTILLVAFSSLTAAAQDGIQILPPSLTLSGPEARHQLIAQSKTGDTLRAQIREGLSYESSNPDVAEVEDGLVTPRSNGTATVTIKAGEFSATAEVTVTGMDQPFTWSFRNHVESVLSKSGCNAGACHGAAAGKNGFYLSLRGYDPEFDFWSITRQARGRRVIPSDPGRSLLLTKPTAMVPHKGGLRFDEGSLEYRVIAEWIAAGQPEPRNDDPRITALEILPKQIVVQPGVEQQFVVRAHFSDERVEDVTRWARFNSTNSNVAEVDQRGLATIKGYGEGAVGAWYLGQNVVGIITSPYDNGVPEYVFERESSDNLIDKHVIEKLKRLNIPPSPVCSDSEFIRRVYLDTLGILPTEEETKTFLLSSDPDKRNKLIDEVLERPEFVDYWTYRWSDLFLLSGEKLRPKALEAFSAWIREQVEANTPWDEFAKQVILATGNSYENGAVNFYTLHQDPLDTAETVSMAFMGMAINCARCHDHPLEKWTNNDYYGMANLFSRVRAKGWGGDFRNGDGNRDVYVVERGELIQPRLGKPQPPRPLEGEPVSFESTEDRRKYLVEWLISDDNPYFSKAITNRVWANFLGVGIVENVDDLRLTNPPSNAALFDALATYLQEQGYDLKALMRLILQSKTYQRSSQFIAGNESDERFYSHYYPRRLKAEVLLDAVSQVLEAPTKFEGYEEGTRALQLKDVNVSSYFLDTFGRPERLVTCECERSDEPSMVQVLHLVNGDTLNQKLAREKNLIGKIVEQQVPDEDVVESAYLRAFSRFPTGEERIKILTVLSQSPPRDRRQAIEDLYWSLLSSREFLFQH